MILTAVIVGSMSLGLLTQLFKTEPKAKTPDTTPDNPPQETLEEKVHRVREEFFENMDRGTCWTEAVAVLREELGMDDDIVPYTEDEQARMEQIVIQRGEEFGQNLSPAFNRKDVA